MQLGLAGAALAFGIYSVLAGLIVPQVSFFSASIVNQERFASAVGIPVQVFRALCAVIAGVSILGIREIWISESRLQLELANDELKQSQEQT